MSALDFSVPMPIYFLASSESITSNLTSTPQGKKHGLIDDLGFHPRKLSINRSPNISSV